MAAPHQPQLPHLQVASGSSLQYGTAAPQRIVERAAVDGHAHIALTDRDGVYGAVPWVRACQEHGINWRTVAKKLVRACR